MPESELIQDLDAYVWVSWGSSIQYCDDEADTTQVRSRKTHKIESRYVCDPPIEGDASACRTPSPQWANGDDAAVFGNVDVGKYLSSDVQRLQDDIAATLYEHRSDARSEGEVGPSETAISACIKVALHIAPWLAPTPGMKWAAFGEDTGCVSLVLRSVDKERRVDFAISDDGKHVSAVCIDENLTTSSVPMSPNDRKRLREQAAWVNG